MIKSRPKDNNPKPWLISYTPRLLLAIEAAAKANPEYPWSLDSYQLHFSDPNLFIGPTLSPRNSPAFLAHYTCFVLWPLSFVRCQTASVPQWTTKLGPTSVYMSIGLPTFPDRRCWVSAGRCSLRHTRAVRRSWRLSGTVTGTSTSCWDGARSSSRLSSSPASSYSTQSFRSSTSSHPTRWSVCIVSK